jgi:hypothetical protein
MRFAGEGQRGSVFLPCWPHHAAVSLAASGWKCYLKRYLESEIRQFWPESCPRKHNHDTNETFIPMTGRWRASWENENGEVEHVDLDPLDVVSFPPGMIRRFENITEGDPNEDSILMFVIGGDAPRAEFTDQAMHELETAGVWPSRS